MAERPLQFPSLNASNALRRTHTQPTHPTSTHPPTHTHTHTNSDNVCAREDIRASCPDSKAICEATTKNNHTMPPKEANNTETLRCNEQDTTDEAVLREHQEMDGNTR